MSLVAKPIRFGLLGAAKISPHAVIAPARQTGLAVVTTVAARDPQRACSYAIRNGIPNVAESYAALIASPEVDAIYNALPPSRHARWSIAALEAGKHVLCEKPLCVTLDEARAMAAASAASGALLVESMHYRYHPQIERALQLVACGAIGALRRIEAVFNSPIPNEPGDIRWKPELGGGALLDLGTYCLHLCRTFGRGEPEVLSGRGRIAANGLIEQFEAALRFGSGVSARVHCDMRGPLALELRLSGSGGTLRLSNPLAPQVFPGRIEVNGQSEAVSGEATYYYQMQAFVEAVRSGRQPLTGAEDCVANFALIDQVRRALTASA